MNTQIVEVLFGTFFILLLIGTPITVSLGVSALAAFMYLGDDPIKIVQMAFRSVGSFPLMALPAFILAGALMVSWFNGNRTFELFMINHHERREVHAKEASQLQP